MASASMTDAELERPFATSIAETEASPPLETSTTLPSGRTESDFIATFLSTTRQTVLTQALIEASTDTSISGPAESKESSPDRPDTSGRHVKGVHDDNRTGCRGPRHLDRQ